MSSVSLKHDERPRTGGDVPANPAASSRARLLARFVLWGALTGLALGLWEAWLIYFHSSSRQFLLVDANYIIWFLAPLVDLTLFGLLGAALGWIEGIGRDLDPRRGVLLEAALLGAVVAHVGWATHFLHTHSANFHVYNGVKAILFPLIRFLAGFVCALGLFKLGWRRLSPFFDVNRGWPLRRMAEGLLTIVGVLLFGLAFCLIRQPTPSFASAAIAPASSSSPNIVLITLDTVRADHLSAYGYAHPTTPNLDRLASRGVLFENAIAPTSWTLPSLASIFIGLLPHQQGADSFRPIALSWTTLAEVLRNRGYETAGFNTNYYYGQAGWGLGQGFSAYDHDGSTAQYNLSRTLLGRVLVQPVYQNLANYDAFYRRDAEHINEHILAWLRHRSGEPFFLYVNYYDAHAPYLAPPPFDHRFGHVSNALVRLASSGKGTQPSRPLSGREQADLAAGYDNCLAYLDTHLGRLMRWLLTSPKGAKTFVIITADHGEALGEHGLYGHGCDLHREEIHVPLLVVGPGVPAGARIAPTVSILNLYATVLDLALGKAFPLHRFSLTRFWDSESPPAVSDEVAISELSTSSVQLGVGQISLTTADWHYIHTARGAEELYGWKTDAAEQTDLSASPQYQQTLHDLHAHLESLVNSSLEPWFGWEYLLALNKPGYSFLREHSLARHSNLLPSPSGAGREALSPVSPSGATGHPTPEEEELLKSLPYE